MSDLDCRHCNEDSLMPEAFRCPDCEIAALRARVAELEAAPEILPEVIAELGRATRRFPTWPTDPLHALAILGEEYGELNKEMLQLVYEPHKTNREKVKTEAIQTAAMAFRLAMSLDRYAYTPGQQHSQQEAPAVERSASEGDRFVGMTLKQVQAEVESEKSLDRAAFKR